MRAFSLFRLRGLISHLALLVLVAGLASCVRTDGFFTPTDQAPLDQNRAADGVIKVGLILPLTSPRANVARTAVSFSNAAQIAYNQDESGLLELITFDNTGTEGGAREAAHKAIAQNVDIILGPLLASSVKEVAKVARPAGVPVVSFSTDSNAAESGVFLMGFLPRTQVNHIVDYSVKTGSRSFAALLPNTPFSFAYADFFRQAVASSGGRLIALDRYPLSRSKIASAIEAVARQASGDNPRIDTIFLADKGANLREVINQLKNKGVNFSKVRLIGTGGFWQDDETLAISELEGALYAWPQEAIWEQFSQVYQRRFGDTPDRTTSLAYDAIGMARHLATTYGAAGFTSDVITDPKGYSGIDGIFRFLPSGINERAMAVYRVERGRGLMIAPPASSFSAP